MKSCLFLKAKAKKDLELNGEKITKLGDYLGLFPGHFQLADFRLVREGPSDRRNGYLPPPPAREYLECLQTYHRALREMPCLKGGGEVESFPLSNKFSHDQPLACSRLGLAFLEITRNWKPVIALSPMMI